MSPSHRALVVVLSDGATEGEAANIRGGLRAMRGVARVVPVNGFPSDGDAIEAIRKDVMAESFEELALVRAQRDELSSRLSSAKDALSGPIPIGHDSIPEWPPTTDGVERSERADGEATA